MKSLQYTISIDAPREKVWDTMMGRYEAWANVAWPGSRFEGDWSEGSRMKFFGDDSGGGTMARVAEVQANKKIAMEHIAVLLEGGVEDTESEIAKGWIGTTENYTFNQQNGSTEVVVDIAAPEEWAGMFEETWPTGLQALKDLVESS